MFEKLGACVDGRVGGKQYAALMRAGQADGRTIVDGLDDDRHIFWKRDGECAVLVFVIRL